MEITIVPVAPSEGQAVPVIAVHGDALMIDGAVADLSVVPDGGCIPIEAINHPLAAGKEWRREGGEMRVALRVPMPRTVAPQDRRKMHVKTVTDGRVPLPSDTGEESPVPAPSGGEPVIVVDEAWVVTPATRLAATRGGMVMDRVDFAKACLAAGIITADEAVAWSAGNALPQVALNLVAAMPEADRAPSQIEMLARTRIRRTAPQVVAIGAALGLTDAEIDALFGA